MPKLKPFDKIEIARKCTGLSSTQKLILLIIATHLGKNDFVYLSYDTLQLECSIAKRTAIADNLTALFNAGVIWILPPSDGYKSNRYGIHFDYLLKNNNHCNHPKLPPRKSLKKTKNKNTPVTNGYQTSNQRLPEQEPTVTGVVTNGYPKRNIKKSKRNKRENPVDNLNQEAEAQAELAREEIRRICRIVSH